MNFLSEARKLDVGIPRLALTLHAIELALKSYLLTTGYTVETLRNRNFGHNIRKLIEECVSKDIGDFVELPSIAEDAIDFLTEAHASRTLLYEYTGGINWFADFSETIAESLIKQRCPWKVRLDAIEYNAGP